MSVYVGIDIHRKRSQVAVINQDGKVLANRNVNNGVTPILSVVGSLPPGTPAASRPRTAGDGSRASRGLRLREAPGAPAAVQGHRLGAAETRSTPRSWRSCSARTCCPRPGSRRPQYASCGAGRSWCGCGRCRRTGPRGPGRPRPRPAGLLERAGPGMARLAGPARRLGGGGLRRPGAHRHPGIGHPRARRRGPPARQVRPAGQGPHHAGGVGPFTALVLKASETEPLLKRRNA